MTLWSLKCMGRLIVRLKAIKYNKDFFYYLSFYPDLGFQAAYLQILFFRPHAFISFGAYAFRIFNKIYSPKLCILDPFQ